MREIKFRAWDRKRGEWMMPTTISYPGDSKFSFFTTPDLVLQQYTGLKDKNGKEIYEGDVVNTDSSGAIPSYDGSNRVVEFRNGCWCFGAGRYDDGDWIRFGFWTRSNEGSNQLEQVEVIGYIYEDPELVK